MQISTQNISKAFRFPYNWFWTYILPFIKAFISFFCCKSQYLILWIARYFYSFVTLVYKVKSFISIDSLRNSSSLIYGQFSSLIFMLFFSLSFLKTGRTKLTSIFRTCAPIASQSDTWRLAMVLLLSFDTLAMGNYPYPSNYLTGGGPLLPAYPVVAACTPLATPNLTGWKCLHFHHSDNMTIQVQW